MNFIKGEQYMSEDLFVTAWKKGIKIVGVEFFNIKASSLDAAEKKWQLEPNYTFIQSAMGGYSHGKQVLLAMMYSFFDPEDGQKFLEKTQTPNFVQTLSILNPESRQIISELWLHYTGW
ncbi:Uncharacterised protein [Legionella pneumophila]|uniref:Uncharacterized protein n=3 Tax=Legionellaceae TaxID=444 RepID=A0A3A6UTC6_LEGPN|nr:MULTISPECIES: hypothetical protein [Legionella]ERB42454.1 hypothetical protein N748_03670 [Legionella pneumophila str. 121004]ERH41170.1 hypothetical protein N751_17340 [Legionella pneumophila str. Leg01/11]QOD89857.1 hypothetical protein IF130_16080 [Legionella pneumophila subsp. pneumophila]ANN97210.1 hypothetical protein A9P84_15660 [Legionella pneumophila]MCW8465656.1 hypothetical protein [Legionella pneumophila]